MTEFFKVQSRKQVLAHYESFSPVEEEEIRLDEALDRVPSRLLKSFEDVPPFPRSTMDGFAVRARDTFGASESLPGLFDIAGEAVMGKVPACSVGYGEAVRIPTGAMLPQGADSVVMVEYTQLIDDRTVEVFKIVAPGENIVDTGEDIRSGEDAVPRIRPLQPQDIGLLAALGFERLWVRRRPVVAILSTGDEVVPVGAKPTGGQIRDINGPALAALVRRQGAVPIEMGIVSDNRDELEARCLEGLEKADCVLLSGGSSVGTRDYALDVLAGLPGAEVLAHGVAVKPGKPTLVVRAGSKALFGLPGHPVSALVIFHVLVKPLLNRLLGMNDPPMPWNIRARISRNLASAQGREDYVRVTLFEEDGEQWAKPVLGASGLINTLVKADGLIRIDSHAEGLNRGEWVEVEPFP